MRRCRQPDFKAVTVAKQTHGRFARYPTPVGRRTAPCFAPRPSSPHRFAAHRWNADDFRHAGPSLRFPGLAVAHREGSNPVTAGRKALRVYNISTTILSVSAACALSRRPGIGVGAVEVLEMGPQLCLPGNVSPTTGNLGIDVTTTDRAGIAMPSGWIDPSATMSFVGGTLAGRIHSAWHSLHFATWHSRIFLRFICFAMAVWVKDSGLRGRLEWPPGLPG